MPSPGYLLSLLVLGVILVAPVTASPQVRVEQISEPAADASTPVLLWVTSTTELPDLGTWARLPLLAEEDRPPPPPGLLPIHH